MQPVRSQARSSRCPVDGLGIRDRVPDRYCGRRRRDARVPARYRSRRLTMIAPFYSITPPTASRSRAGRPVEGMAHHLSGACGSRRALDRPNAERKEDSARVERSDGRRGSQTCRPFGPGDARSDCVNAGDHSMTFEPAMAAVHGEQMVVFPPHRTDVRRPAQCSVSHHLDRTQRKGADGRGSPSARTRRSE